MLKSEKRNDFKKEILQVHKKDRRDFSLAPKDDELVIKNGLQIVVGKEDNIVVLTAAKDFIDYLFTSMEVSSILVKNKSEGQSLTVSIDKNIDSDAQGFMGYQIEITDDGINLKGYDDRGVAQGLYYLEDLMNLRKGPFLKKEVIKKKAIMETRLTHSPLGVFEYPDEALSLIAHLGFTAIDLWIKDINMTKRGYLDFNLVCQRAEKYGLDVFAEYYAPHTAHPDDEGAQEFYDDIYFKLFDACPKLKGIHLTGEANQFHSRDPKAGLAPYTRNFVDNIPTGKLSPGWWPCRDYPEWVALIQNSVRKFRPDAEVIFCTYNWGFAPEEDRVWLIEHLPDGVAVMATWDMFENVKCGNSTENITDYSLSFVGPGKYFSSEAKAAKKRGLKMYSISNTSGRTWDFGTVPYEPMPYQWIKRYEEILKANKEWNVVGLFENIHYGFHPSIITELEKACLFTNHKPLEEILKDLLMRDFGEENLDAVDKAMHLWSEAITYYVPTNEDQYGAFRTGPSYPFWPGNNTIGLPEGGKIPNDNHPMFGNGIYFEKYTPDGTGRNSLPGVRIYDEINAITKVRDLMKEGISIMEKIENPNDKLLKLINLGKFIYRSCITAINYKNFYILLKKLDIVGDKEEAGKILDKIEDLLLEERKNVEATIPIVQADSRLGWEPSMEYVADEKCLRWKLRQLDYVLDEPMKNFRRANSY